MKAMPVRSLAATVFLAALVALHPSTAPASHTGWMFATGNRVVVSLTDNPSRFSPATVTLEAGKAVDLVLENKGQYTHVFMLYKAPKSPLKSFPEWWDYVAANTYFQNMGEILIHGKSTDSYVAATRVVEVGVGGSQSITVTFIPAKKGTFEFGSHIGGYRKSQYEEGMKGTLIVK